MDFSSAFNTIIPTLFQTKITQLSVPSSICQWITSVQTDRLQLYWGNSCQTPAPQTLVPLRDVFSPYYSSPTTPTTVRPLHNPELGHSHQLHCKKKEKPNEGFNLPQELLKQFYSAVTESVLCTSITVWFGSATKSGIIRLQRTVWTAERIISAPVPTIQELYLTLVIWLALQSPNYQDSQAQEQFLPPGNPTYEPLNAPPPLCNH